MKNKRGSITLAILLVIIIVISAAYLITKYFNVDTDVKINLTYKNTTQEEPKNQINQTEVTNPASLLCTQRNHTLENRISQTKGEYNVCIDNKQNECEEWAYFRGECELNENK